MSRSPNPVGITRLGGAVVAVPSPPRTAAWLHEALFFDVREDADGSWVATVGGDYRAPVPSRTITLVPGDQLQLLGVLFDTYRDTDADELLTRLGEHGVAGKVVGAGDLAGPGVMFTDPWGLDVHVREPAPPLPHELARSSIRPRRIGHVNIKNPEPARAAGFYRSVLGLKLSEQLGDAFIFLRIDSEHHNLALRTTDAGVNAHHLAFEIAGFETYRPILDHLAALGLTIEYGIGRHAPGRNLFAYLRDPDSLLRLELFCDMAHIYDDDQYAPRRWRVDDRPHTVNVWGPQPPPSFLE